jgi:hypothetical protein
MAAVRYVGFEVLAAVAIKSFVFWVTAHLIL